MKRLAIAMVASALMAVPAVAQQSQGSNLGNVLENIGRSLNGQSGPPPQSNQSYQNAYQQTYNNSQQQYRNESNQQLEQDEQHLQSAWNQLHATSQALDEEMARRGLRTGNNQNGYNGPNGGNYSGSSTYRGNGNGPAPNGRSNGPSYNDSNGYNGPNGPYNGR